MPFKLTSTGYRWVPEAPGEQKGPPPKLDGNYIPYRKPSTPAASCGDVHLLDPEGDTILLIGQAMYRVSSLTLTGASRSLAALIEQGKKRPDPRAPLGLPSEYSGRGFVGVFKALHLGQKWEPESTGELYDCARAASSLECVKNLYWFFRLCCNNFMAKRPVRCEDVVDLLAVAHHVKLDQVFVTATVLLVYEAARPVTNYFNHPSGCALGKQLFETLEISRLGLHQFVVETMMKSLFTGNCKTPGCPAQANDIVTYLVELSHIGVYPPQLSHTGVGDFLQRLRNFIPPQREAPDTCDVHDVTRSRMEDVKDMYQQISRHYRGLPLGGRTRAGICVWKQRFEERRFEILFGGHKIGDLTLNSCTTVHLFFARVLELVTSRLPKIRKVVSIVCHSISTAPILIPENGNEEYMLFLEFVGRCETQTQVRLFVNGF